MASFNFPLCYNLQFLNIFIVTFYKKILKIHSNTHAFYNEAMPLGTVSTLKRVNFEMFTTVENTKNNWVIYSENHPPIPRH